MDKMEVVKFFIQKTRQEVKQEEREKEVKKWFKSIFGIEPERVVWGEDGSLRARTVVLTKEWEMYILGNKVWEVKFEITELETENQWDFDWVYREVNEENRIIYKWEKNVGKFRVCVEIKTIK